MEDKQRDLLKLVSECQTLYHDDELLVAFYNANGGQEAYHQCIKEGLLRSVHRTDKGYAIISLTPAGREALDKE